VGSALCAAFYAVGDGPARHAIAAVMAVSAARAIAVGIDRFTPSMRRGWVLVAGAMVSFALGETIWTVLAIEGDRSGFPIPVGFCVLVGFILQTLGVFRMAIARRSTQWFVDVLDAATVALAVLLLTWTFAIAPHIADSRSAPAIFLSLIFPALSILTFWVVGHFLARPRPATPSARLLLVGFGLSAFGVVSATALGKAMTTEVSLWFIGVWPLASVVIGSAALHPTMVALTEPVLDDRRVRAWQRLLTITGAVLVTEVALHLGGKDTELVDVVGTSLMLVLLIARLGLVLHQHETELIDKSLLEARHRSVLSALEEGVVLQDHEGRVIDANPAAMKLLGGPLDGTRMRKIEQRTQLIHPDGTPVQEEDRPGRVAMRSGAPQTGIVFGARRVDGAVRWYEANAIPLAPDRSIPRGAVVSSFRDVTEKREGAQRLADAKREAEEAALVAERANRAKSEFLSRMSHELRTPMNAVLGFGQLLGMDELNANQHDSVDQIIRAGEHLLTLINDVLEISRIDAGHVSMSIEPVQVADVVSSALDLIRSAADKESIDVRVACGPLGERFVSGDRQRLVQVLVNVLSNAVKYNRPGGTIDVTCSQPAGPDRLRILVTDTGPGIAPELMSRVFTAFDRLGAETSAIEGTGIGLSLSRGLVEHMGGCMGVHSTPGLGSTFWIELAVTTAPVLGAPMRASKAAFTLDERLSRTILIVEDNLSNLRLIERVFEARPGIKLISAMQGQVGLDLAALHVPDLIMLDIHLPDIDGTEVLRSLRHNPATASIPVAILSADATAGQIQRLTDAGAAHYLTKPFDIDELLAVVDGTPPLAQRIDS